MPFDPDCAALVTRLRELNLPRYETMTPLQAREAMAAARKAAAMVPPAIAEARDIVAETSEGSLHARLYRPGSDAESRPTLVFFHGGGWVLGDLDSHDMLCRSLSIAGKSNERPRPNEGPQLVRHPACAWRQSRLALSLACSLSQSLVLAGSRTACAALPSELCHSASLAGLAPGKSPSALCILPAIRGSGGSALLQSHWHQ